MNDRILVIDDELKIRMILKRMLESDGYQVRGAGGGQEGLAIVESFEPALILLDLKMPGMDGLEVLQNLGGAGYSGKVIILTAFGSISSAVQAMRAGAYDYITKPFDPEELLIVVERTLRQEKTERELRAAKQRLEEKYSVCGIVTANAEMEKLLETVLKIAPSDVSVMIHGASGTGKELFANAIHQHSFRSDGAFLALNCSAIPETLIESELFGYKAGAFTGASKNKLGLVAQADGGTMFLDEISELSPEVQAKLLRFLESGEFIPLGGSGKQEVDVRIISASNRNLSAEVASGRFREDLFYRLNVVTLSIPPLCDRADDIPLLIDHFLKKHSKEFGKTDFTFSPEALEVLQLYSWPGNVRELENAVKSALVLATESQIGVRDLPITLSNLYLGRELTETSCESLYKIASLHKETAEKSALLRALRQCDWNRTKTAKLLGIGRRTLFRKIKRYRLKPQ